MEVTKWIERGGVRFSILRIRKKVHDSILVYCGTDYGVCHIYSGIQNSNPHTRLLLLSVLIDNAMDGQG